MAVHRRFDAASGSEDGVLRLWRTEDGTCGGVLKGHLGCIWSVCVEWHHLQALTSSSDRTVKRWDLEACEVLQTFKGHQGAVLSVAGDWEARRVYSGSTDLAIRVWDLESGACLHVLRGHLAAVGCISADWNAQELLTGSVDRTLCLWDLASMRCTQVLEGHREAVTSVEVLWGPGEREVLSASADHTLILWELTTGVPRRTFTGHLDVVSHVVAGWEDRYAVSASDDGTLKLWQLDHGSLLRSFAARGSCRLVTVAVDWSLQRVFAGGGNGQLQLWALDDSSRPLRQWCRSTSNVHCSAIQGPDSLAEDRRYQVLEEGWRQQEALRLGRVQEEKTEADRRLQEKREESWKRAELRRQHEEAERTRREEEAERDEERRLRRREQDKELKRQEVERLRREEEEEAREAKLLEAREREAKEREAREREAREREAKERQAKEREAREREARERELRRGGEERGGEAWRPLDEQRGEAFAVEPAPVTESTARPFELSKLATHITGGVTDKYDVIRQLGAGVGGVAYLVKPKMGPSDSLYCAKEVSDNMRASIEEFKMLSRLQHPNVLRVLELVEGSDFTDGKWFDRVWIISELAEGGDLYKWMKQFLASRGKEQLTEERLAGLHKQAMQGLRYVHAQGVMHCDLKPDNLLMTRPYADPRPSHVVIADFSLAAKLDAGDTASDFSEGDPRYVSPEVLAATTNQPGKRSPPGVGSDVWSMGVTLYELLSGGCLPFLYKSCSLDEYCSLPEVELVAHEEAILSKPLQLVREVRGLSAEAKDLLSGMLTKDPADRLTTREVIGHDWFSMHGHHPISKAAAEQFELTATRTAAQRMLATALSAKLQREHHEKAWRVFEALDADHSGQLSPSEFEAGAMKLGKTPSDAKVLFKRADIDKCGHLNFHEFVAATFDWTSVDPGAMQSALKELLHQLDADQSGEVTIHELSGLFHDVLEEGELEEALRCIDTSKDGKICYSELGSFLAR